MDNKQGKPSFLSSQNMTWKNYGKMLLAPAFVFIIAIIIAPYVTRFGSFPRTLAIYFLFIIPFCPFTLKEIEKIKKNHPICFGGANESVLIVTFYLLSPFIFIYKFLKYYLNTTQE
ncbi:hypothetical protein ACLSZW_02135 [Avibacterium avium]|uniref:hypothetical protein n=1 Tax=Avibacterium avium TaxID=751 RepID=UPI003BF87037